MRRQYSLDRELFFQKPYNFFSQFIVVKSIEFINKQKADFIGMFITVKKSLYIFQKNIKIDVNVFTKTSIFSRVIFFSAPLKFLYKVYSQFRLMPVTDSSSIFSFFELFLLRCILKHYMRLG